jgi:DNA-binding IscR family transcriptional regulator
MEPDENKTETGTNTKIDEIIERSNIQSQILKKVLTELNNRSKLLESEEVKFSKKTEK